MHDEAVQQEIREAILCYFFAWMVLCQEKGQEKGGGASPGGGGWACEPRGRREVFTRKELDRQVHASLLKWLKIRDLAPMVQWVQWVCEVGGEGAKVVCVRVCKCVYVKGFN